MSYEGFTQYICTNGHEYHVDVMVGYAGFESKEDRIQAYQCPYCKANAHWYASVNETNGYDERDPTTYPRPTVEVARYDVPQEDHRGNKFMSIEIKLAPKDPIQWRLWQQE